jgi:3-hydroxybutyryl-CoA dehydrogenase
VTQSIRKVAVIGAGQAGRRFALRCAQAGFDVVLEDVMPANLRRAEAEFSDLSGKLTTGSMNFALTVEDAVREADIAIDFVPDELESKLEIFCLLDRMAPPKTILCTPSEALSITDLASCTYRDDRCLAIRGNLSTGDHLSLLYPESVFTGAVSAASNFFITLGLIISSQPDPNPPMLMKNAGS